MLWGSVSDLDCLYASEGTIFQSCSLTHRKEGTISAHVPHYTTPLFRTSQSWDCISVPLFKLRFHVFSFLRSAFLMSICYVSFSSTSLITIGCKVASSLELNTPNFFPHSVSVCSVWFLWGKDCICVFRMVPLRYGMYLCVPYGSCEVRTVSVCSVWFSQ
jgi:hypothetical protein